MTGIKLRVSDWPIGLSQSRLTNENSEVLFITPCQVCVVGRQRYDWDVDVKGDNSMAS